MKKSPQNYIGRATPDSSKPQLFIISIPQPFAEFIIAGIQPIYNTFWTADFRGPLLVHASKIFCKGWRELTRLSLLPQLDQYIKNRSVASKGFYSYANMPCNQILGAVIFYDAILPGHSIPAASAAVPEHNWASLHHHKLLFASPTRFHYPKPLKRTIYKLLTVSEDFLMPIDLTAVSALKKIYGAYKHEIS